MTTNNTQIDAKTRALYQRIETGACREFCNFHAFVSHQQVQLTDGKCNTIVLKGPILEIGMELMLLSNVLIKISDYGFECAHDSWPLPGEKEKGR